MRKYFAVMLALCFLVATSCWATEDMRSNIMPKVAVKNTSNSGNTATTGEIIDRLNYESVTFIIMTGTLADSDMTLTPTVQVCAIDNCDDAASAAAGTLIGTVAAATFAASDDDSVKSIGYNGVARYVRLVLTPAANSSAAAYEAVCILGHPKKRPVQ